ncbi:unnamed protein product [Clonostachys rosea f. rosea IK726]|uniref:Cytochrome P450 monooxygenase n=2 Tax=Bionectria ochroleuca TaxID=29856 RepID=A0A0B7KIN9_BIOOC|nr:unnamed protein product [Clonostachys rosea f. rosea IK726]
MGILLHSQAQRRFVTSSRELLSEARKTFPDRIFRIMTDLGEVMFLPNQFAEEIKNDHGFSFTTAFEKPEVRPVNQRIEFRLLTQAAQVWTEVVARDRVLDIVARVSSRIYLGDEVCRNARWLAITKLYTTHFFSAATKLRMYPHIVRHLVHWFIPECKLLRSQFNDAQKILQPIINYRRDLRRAALATGEPVPEFGDALGWVEREATAKSVDCNPSIFQLLLSTVSINTTADLLEQCMLSIAQHPEIINPLREEIRDVLRHSGWSKSSLSDMKLLDSVIKESQRLKPTSIAAMRRRVEEDVTLSNGVTLKRGTRVYVDASRMWDPSLHHHPEQWDGYRFLRLRSIPGRERMAQLASTSPDHLAFGHGEHACPGRFLAISVIKIVLCHLVLKYDWMLSPGTDVKPVTNGILAVASPTARLLIRRRRGTAGVPGVIE